MSLPHHNYATYNAQLVGQSFEKLLHQCDVIAYPPTPALLGPTKLIELLVTVANAVAGLPHRPHEQETYWSTVTGTARHAENDAVEKADLYNQHLRPSAGKEEEYVKFWTRARSSNHPSKAWECSTFARRIVEETCWDMFAGSTHPKHVDVALFLASRDFGHLNTIYSHIVAIKVALDYVCKWQNLAPEYFPSFYHSRSPIRMSFSQNLHMQDAHFTHASINLASVSSPLEHLVDEGHWGRLLDLAVVTCTALSGLKFSSGTNEEQRELHEYRGRCQTSLETFRKWQREHGGATEVTEARQNRLIAILNATNRLVSNQLSQVVYDSTGGGHSYLLTFIRGTFYQMMERAQTSHQIERRLFLAAEGFNQLRNVYELCLAAEAAFTYIQQSLLHNTTYKPRMWSFPGGTLRSSPVVPPQGHSISVYQPRPRASRVQVVAARWTGE